MKTDTDAELIALKIIVEAMTQLDEKSQRRVLEFLWDKYVTCAEDSHD